MNKTKLLTPHAVFIALLLLSLIGAVITNYYPKTSHFFWLIMLFILAFASVAPDYLQQPRNKSIINSRLLHWLGGLFGVLVIYAYFNSGRLYREEAGLLVLLILAVSTYTDGLKTGWRFSFVGVFLGLIAVSAAYVDTYLWQLSLLAIGATVFSHYENPGSTELSGEGDVRQ